jgi:hypothetical protein
MARASPLPREGRPGRVVSCRPRASVDESIETSKKPLIKSPTKTLPKGSPCQNVPTVTAYRAVNRTTSGTF